MQNDILNNLLKLTQDSLDNMKKAAKANQSVAENLLKEQNDVIKAVIDAAEQSLNASKTLKDPKDLNDFASKQADIAQETAEKMMESARSCADILSDAAKTYNKIFEASAETATKASSGKSTKAA